MATSRVVSQVIDREATDSAHVEILNFVRMGNPGVVEKQRDKVLYLDDYLESRDLVKTSALVADFLRDSGRKLAADFLQAKDPKLIRSFVVLYCARDQKKINTGVGQVTIFLALGTLSSGNGLPKFGDDTESQELQSGDSVIVGKNTAQILDKNEGGGLALVSDWSI